MSSERPVGWQNARREGNLRPQGFARALCFSPDSKTFATGGYGRVLLWDLTQPPLGSDVRRERIRRPPLIAQTCSAARSLGNPAEVGANTESASYVSPARPRPVSAGYCIETTSKPRRNSVKTAAVLGTNVLAYKRCYTGAKTLAGPLGSREAKVNADKEVSLTAGVRSGPHVRLSGAS